MKHLGDITKLDGGKIEPVDCITFGSPCQDVSAAGRRDGLSGEHSRLFFEAVRIIKEMREATHGRYPTFAVWENVPGAFSSHKGKDFQEALRQLAGIAAPAADVPGPPGGKWRTSGVILGDGWSLAWRVHNAQFWGVPQRRRRIALVVDFGGDRAPEILFDRRRLPGDPQESGAEGQVPASGAEGSAGIPGGALPGDCPGAGNALGAVHCGGTAYGFTQNAGERAGNIGYSKEVSPTVKADGKSAGVLCLNDQGGSKMECSEDCSGTLRAQEHGHQPVVLPFDTTQITSKQNGSHPMYGSSCHSLAAQAHPPCICIATGQSNAEVMTNNCPTLNCNHEQSIVARTLRAKGCLSFREDSNTIIFFQSYARRLIPVECERLQGYPDGWTDIGPWRESNGKRHKESTDSARYTALGNSIALPFWYWLMERIGKYLPAGATLGSLFDGIGGFPLCWEAVQGKGTALWASEIEEFPIAVTRKRFGKE